MNSFASISDMNALWRPMTVAETSRASGLLPVVSDLLRNEAYKCGRDLDEMIADNPVLANVAKSVTIDIVGRVLNTATTGEPLSQSTESAGGYSFTGTFLSAGGGVFIKRDELKKLGLIRQRIGVIDQCPE